MKVMYMHRVLHYVIAKVVCFTIYTRLYTTACHPDSKTARMMVTPIIIFGKLALTIVGSAKLTTPNHQGFIQQASLFQIGYQGGTRLVYIFTLTYNLPWQVVVC